MTTDALDIALAGMDGEDLGFLRLPTDFASSNPAIAERFRQFQTGVKQVQSLLPATISKPVAMVTTPSPVVRETFTTSNEVKMTQVPLIPYSPAPIQTAPLVIPQPTAVSPLVQTVIQIGRAHV